jgi:hypothetical protein
MQAGRGATVTDRDRDLTRPGCTSAMATGRYHSQDYLDIPPNNRTTTTTTTTTYCHGGQNVALSPRPNNNNNNNITAGWPP